MDLSKTTSNMSSNSPHPATSEGSKDGRASSTPTSASSTGGMPPTPSSKLLNHVPLDAPDELDRKWYAHFYHFQKAVQNKDDKDVLAMLKSMVDANAISTPLQFQPDIAMVYAILTEPPLAKQYLKFLTCYASADNYKNCVGYLQKIIDLKYMKLIVSCRSQLLWLIRELVHMNASGVDRVVTCLMRYITGGDQSRTNIWLTSSILRILMEHESWLLGCSSLIPYVFHTFARVCVDHTSPQHGNLLKQEVELCTTLWNRRQTDVAHLGRELVRVLNDAKDVAGMSQIWKQLRSARNPPNDKAEKDLASVSVASLMCTPTPPKFLAYRLTPRMEECLVFMMEKVQLGYVTRYQKWFSSHFLTSPGSEALVPDIVRYVCAVYHPSNQLLGSKITPRYHILGWLYLLWWSAVCKTPSVLARVQLAMFFDYLYFKATDNIMNVEPAMLLMVKSLRSHPTLTLSMIQFLLFAVEKFAASPSNRQKMQKGVSTAFTMLLKLGVVPSLAPLQSFPALEASAPELKSELHRLFPEHFPSESQSANPVNHPPAGVIAPTETGSSPSSLVPTYASESPIRTSPGPVSTSPLSSPHLLRSPSRSSEVAPTGSSDSSSLSSSTFLPDSKQATEQGATSTSPTRKPELNSISGAHAAPEGLVALEPPASLIVLGEDEFKTFREKMPRPDGQVTEGFLEALNDLLINWTRQSNALELATPLGEYLYKSLERIVVTSKINQSATPKATRSSILDSVFDQAMTENADLYLPFIHAMHTRDRSIGFRLLAYCCLKGRVKPSEEALLPYYQFAEKLGLTLVQGVLQDLALSEHIDGARELALGLLDQKDGDDNADELGAVETATMVILPFLLQDHTHRMLSSLTTKREALVHLMVRLATPSILSVLSSRILLKEFAVFKDRIATILLSSLQWSSWEQYGAWDLLLTELQASAAALSSKELMAAARKVLACVDPKEHSEALNGLSKCLIHFAPDTKSLQSMFSLSNDFQDFACGVLACWIEKYPEIVKNYVLVIIQTTDRGTSDVNHVLEKLEHIQRQRSELYPPGESTLWKDDVVVSALRRLLQQDPGRMESDHYPMLRAVLMESDEPPTKKQRLLPMPSTST